MGCSWQCCTLDYCMQDTVLNGLWDLPQFPFPQRDLKNRDDPIGVRGFCMKAEDLNNLLRFLFFPAFLIFKTLFLCALVWKLYLLPNLTCILTTTNLLPPRSHSCWTAFTYTQGWRHLMQCPRGKVHNTIKCKIKVFVRSQFDGSPLASLTAQAVPSGWCLPTLGTGYCADFPTTKENQSRRQKSRGVERNM